MTFRQIVTVSLAVVLLLTAALAGLWAATRKGLAEEVEVAAALPVQTMRMRRVTSYLERRAFTGVLKSARTSELGFERTGRLMVVEVDEGDSVAQGQILARLDTRNLAAKRRELKAQEAAAESLLQELEAGPRQQTIDAARAEVRDLQAQAELAALNLDRRERLLKGQAISQEDYDRRALGLRSIQAKLDAAQRRLDELEAGTRIEAIDAQRAVVEQIRAALADNQVEIDESTLVAPYAGIVGKRYLDEGAIVSPGAPLVRLVENQRLEAWIGLPADLASKLKSDDRFNVRIGRHEREATVDSVLPEMDAATRTRTAILRLTSSAGVFAGQVARIEIQDEAEEDGFWLPITALARGNRGLWSVLVAEPSDAGGTQAAQRDVELLHTDGERVLVRGTLQDEDEVIVSGTHRVVEGQRVVAHRGSSPSGSRKVRGSGGSEIVSPGH